MKKIEEEGEGECVGFPLYAHRPSLGLGSVKSWLSPPCAVSAYLYHWLVMGARDHLEGPVLHVLQARGGAKRGYGTYKWIYMDIWINEPRVGTEDGVCHFQCVCWGVGREIAAEMAIEMEMI